MKTTLIILVIIIILLILFIIGVFQFYKCIRTEKMTPEEHMYIAKKMILENKDKRDCYSMYDIQKMQQENDLFLEIQKHNKK